MAAVKSAFASLLLALASGAFACSGSQQPGALDPSAQAGGGSGDVTITGVDTSTLTPRERREWSGYVSEFLAPCPDIPVPVAQCVNEKRACSRCLPAAKFLAKGVRDGLSREQVEHGYKNRFNADRVKNVPVDGSPSKGSENATVTVVEFADFECHFCAAMAPRLDQLWADRHAQIRMVYKFMPLPAHPHGEVSARAGFAASLQGKFWEMNAKMFEGQKHLEQADLEGYAKDLGMDVAKLRADMTSDAATERLARDRKLADALGVKGTPTIYINGREFDLQQDLGEWVGAELAAPPSETAAAPKNGGNR